MKMNMLFAAGLSALLFSACGGDTQTAVAQKDDSVAAIPDSVPQRVVLGKEAEWAFKPDTMMNDFILGEGKGMRNFFYDNGSNGETNDGVTARPYLNTKEKEKMTLFTVKSGGEDVPFAFRLEKFEMTPTTDKTELNFTTIPNFITSHGIYIGMPVDYVQSIYKGQPMMKWIKGDTTYLTYTPMGKDKSHFHRYAHTDYSAGYKFVNDQCRVIEMHVRPEAVKK